MRYERKRHWYIVRRLGSAKISCLLSAFSKDHIKRKAALNEEDVIIERAKRWQIVKVFSGSPIFYDYKLQEGKYRNMNAPEDVESFVGNEFHTEMDGEKTLVKVLS